MNILILCLVFLVCVSDCYAYLDPGTGSFLFQMLIGALLGALFVVKSYWVKIKNFFISIFKKGKNE